MVEPTVIELRTVDDFRRWKSHDRGVIVMRRAGSSTSVHHPSCPHVREDLFVEKLENRGRPGYFWATDLEVAKRQWPLARTCGHPSDPLCGGSGGPGGTRSHASSVTESVGTTWEVKGPSRTERAVRAVAATPLPFESRTEDQKAFRAALRTQLRRLETRDTEILHALFVGDKPPTADVENLLLYNLGDSCFVGGRRGIRFELAPAGVIPPGGSVKYVYRPVPAERGFSLWTTTAVLARWRAVGLGQRTVDRARAWLALRTADVALAGTAPAAPPEFFGVRLGVAVPKGTRASAVSLAKPLIDAAVCAIQAASDTPTSDQAAERLGVAVDVDPNEVARLLADDSRAVLGRTQSLVHVRGDGFQLNPSDDRCIAGEVVLKESENANWIVDAEVIEVTPTVPRR